VLPPEELLEDVPLEELVPEELLLDEVPVTRSSGSSVGEDVVETDPQAASMRSSEQMTLRTNVVADTAELCPL
jgi:hypothetical protein